MLPVKTDESLPPMLNGSWRLETIIAFERACQLHGTLFFYFLICMS